MPGFRRLAAIATWIAIAIAYVAAILPQREAPHIGYGDKLDHMAAFFTITVLARLGYPRLRAIRLLASMAAFGGFIELSQAVPMIGRDAEWADWFADIAASGLALLIAWPLSRAVAALDRRAAPAPRP